MQYEYEIPLDLFRQRYHFKNTKSHTKYLIRIAISYLVWNFHTLRKNSKKNYSLVVASILNYQRAGKIIATSPIISLLYSALKVIQVVCRNCMFLWCKPVTFFFYRCTVHSDIHTVHSPRNADLLKLWLQFTLKLDGSYMFRSTTVIRELAIESG
jgi:hypothetical protein